jgi:hypothetical protein
MLESIVIMVAIEAATGPGLVHFPARGRVTWTRLLARVCVALPKRGDNASPQGRRLTLKKGYRGVILQSAST